MSQFAIHQDVENQVPRRGKSANTRNNGQKRAVLGVITNQANQNIRVQPSRAAKPKVSVFILLLKIGWKCILDTCINHSLQVQGPNLHSFQQICYQTFRYVLNFEMPLPSFCQFAQTYSFESRLESFPVSQSEKIKIPSFQNRQLAHSITVVL